MSWVRRRWTASSSAETSSISSFLPSSGSRAWDDPWPMAGVRRGLPGGGSGRGPRWSTGVSSQSARAVMAASMTGSATRMSRAGGVGAAVACWMSINHRNRTCCMKSRFSRWLGANPSRLATVSFSPAASSSQSYPVSMCSLPQAARANPSFISFMSWEAGRILWIHKLLPMASEIGALGS